MVSKRALPCPYCPPRCLRCVRYKGTFWGQSLLSEAEEQNFRRMHHRPKWQRRLDCSRGQTLMHRRLTSSTGTSETKRRAKASSNSTTEGRRSLPEGRYSGNGRVRAKNAGLGVAGFVVGFSLSVLLTSSLGVGTRARISEDQTSIQKSDLQDRFGTSGDCSSGNCTTRHDDSGTIEEAVSEVLDDGQIEHLQSHSSGAKSSQAAAPPYMSRQRLSSTFRDFRGLLSDASVEAVNTFSSVASFLATDSDADVVRETVGSGGGESSESRVDGEAPGIGKKTGAARTITQPLRTMSHIDEVLEDVDDENSDEIFSASRLSRRNERGLIARARFSLLIRLAASEKNCTKEVVDALARYVSTPEGALTLAERCTRYGKNSLLNISRFGDDADGGIGQALLGLVEADREVIMGPANVAALLRLVSEPDVPDSYRCFGFWALSKAASSDLSTMSTAYKVRRILADDRSKKTRTDLLNDQRLWAAIKITDEEDGKRVGMVESPKTSSAARGTKYLEVSVSSQVAALLAVLSHEHGLDHLWRHDILECLLSWSSGHGDRTRQYHALRTLANLCASPTIRWKLQKAQGLDLFLELGRDDLPKRVLRPLLQAVLYFASQTEEGRLAVDPDYLELVEDVEGVEARPGWMGLCMTWMSSSDEQLRLLALSLLSSLARHSEHRAVVLQKWLLHSLEVLASRYPVYRVHIIAQLAKSWNKALGAAQARVGLAAGPSQYEEVLDVGLQRYALKALAKLVEAEENHEPMYTMGVLELVQLLATTREREEFRLRRQTARDRRKSGAVEPPEPYEPSHSYKSNQSQEERPKQGRKSSAGGAAGLLRRLSSAMGLAEPESSVPAASGYRAVQDVGGGGRFIAVPAFDDEPDPPSPSKRRSASLSSSSTLQHPLPPSDLPSAAATTPSTASMTTAAEDSALASALGSGSPRDAVAIERMCALFLANLAGCAMLSPFITKSTLKRHSSYRFSPFPSLKSSVDSVIDSVMERMDSSSAAPTLGSSSSSDRAFPPPPSRLAVAFASSIYDREHSEFIRLLVSWANDLRGDNDKKLRYYAHRALENIREGGLNEKLVYKDGINILYPCDAVKAFERAVPSPRAKEQSKEHVGTSASEPFSLLHRSKESAGGSTCSATRQAADAYGLDVVLIHGLTGSSLGTWTSRESNANLPRAFSGRGRLRQQQQQLLHGEKTLSRPTEGSRGPGREMKGDGPEPMSPTSVVEERLTDSKKALSWTEWWRSWAPNWLHGSAEPSAATLGGSDAVELSSDASGDSEDTSGVGALASGRGSGRNLALEQRCEATDVGGSVGLRGEATLPEAEDAGGRQVLWPVQWLVEDLEAQGLRPRVISVGYEANMLSLSSPWPALTLEERSKLTLEGLISAGVGQSGRKVVFICHSMGGLIAKHMLLTCLSRQAEMESRERGRGPDPSPAQTLSGSETRGTNRALGAGEHYGEPQDPVLRLSEPKAVVVAPLQLQASSSSKQLEEESVAEASSAVGAGGAGQVASARGERRRDKSARASVNKRGSEGRRSDSERDSASKVGNEGGSESETARSEIRGERDQIEGDVDGSSVPVEASPYSALLANTEAVVFYGTPHRGSPIAELRRPALVAELLVHPTLKDLMRSSPLTQKINEDFAALSRRIRCLSLGEGEKWRVNVFVVPPESADPGFGLFRLLEGVGHERLCKPTSRRDPRYTLARDFILQELSQDKCTEPAAMSERKEKREDTINRWNV